MRPLSAASSSRCDSTAQPADGCSRHPHDRPRRLGREAASPPAQELLRCARHADRHAAQAARPAPAGASSSRHPAGIPRYTICVLPFVNMSGDPEQEYFSDGITEDIITDLSKVSALGIVARNSAFMYKGKKRRHPESRARAQGQPRARGQRPQGGRPDPDHRPADRRRDQQPVWADRYDRDQRHLRAAGRDLEAIVKALRLQAAAGGEKGHRAARHRQCRGLQPLPDGAAEVRHRHRVETRAGRRHHSDVPRATEIDPAYAQAWALMAIGQKCGISPGRRGDDGMAAAERALALDPNLAEAHAVKAQILLRTAARRGGGGGRHRAAAGSRVLRGQQVSRVPANPAAPPGGGDTLLRKGDDADGDGRQLA